MAILVDCPCGKKLKAPDTAAGKRVKCPSCAAIVAVPAPKTPAPSAMLELADDEDAGEAADACPSCRAPLPEGAVICVACGLDLRTGQRVGEAAPRPKKRKRANASVTALGWKTVRTGLTMVYVGFPCMILIPITGGVLALLLGCFLGPLGVAIPIAVGALGFVAAAVSAVVGAYLCMAVPSESGGKPLIIGAVCSWTPYLGLLIIGLIIAISQGMQQTRNPPAPPGAPGVQLPFGTDVLILAVMAWIGLAVGNVLFLLFLRKVAQYFGDDYVPSSVFKVLILWGVLFVFGIIPPNVHAQLGAFSAVLGLFAAVGSLTFLAWYLILVRATRDMIHLSRAGRG